MREILFRGQTRKFGEKVNMNGDKLPGKWVYGGIFPQKKGGAYSIIYTYDPIDKYPVYAETVGQYTGLVDKNGAKIFEGDVIQDIKTNELFTICWHGSFAQFVASELRKPNKATRNYHDLFLKDRGSIVIGNIFDNPELLSKAERRT